MGDKVIHSYSFCYFTSTDFIWKLLFIPNTSLIAHSLVHLIDNCYFIPCTATVVVLVKEVNILRIYRWLHFQKANHQKVIKTLTVILPSNFYNYESHRFIPTAAKQLKAILYTKRNRSLVSSPRIYSLLTNFDDKDEETGA